MHCWICRSRNLRMISCLSLSNLLCHNSISIRRMIHSRNLLRSVIIADTLIIIACLLVRNKMSSVKPAVLKRSAPQTTSKTAEYHFRKAIKITNKLQHQQNIEELKAVGDYEETINPVRIVYCGCGVPMIGASKSFQDCSCALHKQFGKYVFDPACSESCRDFFGFTCEHCHSVMGRVYGPAMNGDLRCSSVCR